MKKAIFVIAMTGLKAFLLFSFYNPTSAFAEETGIFIKLGEARTKKSLLALPPPLFLGAPNSSPKHKSVGTELYNTINNNLTVSSYFQMVSTSAYLEDPNKTSLLPAPNEPNGFKFQSWSAIGTDFLIRIGYSVVENDLSVETYTYHIPKASLIVGKKYKGPVSSARRIAHMFSNDLLKALTGKQGPFLSKIVFSSDRAGGPAKEIFISDWDGNNMEKISNHRSIAISPAWSPDASKIAYTAYVKRVGEKFRNADMLLYDLKSGKRSLLSFLPGINSGAAFAPDNKHIYLTVSKSMNPDIYRMAFDGTSVTKITSGPAGAMNVEPAIANDGRLAFSSDRGGRPMIYTADSNGGNIKRVTIAGVFNSSPAWSPDGNKIAFAGQSDGNFDIFVMNSDGTNLIRVTSAKKLNGRMANNEDPSFSPDGRFLIYTSNRTGKNQIFISTADGSEERRITEDNYNYFKPKWSNNIE
jgi:TolB protein